MVTFLNFFFMAALLHSKAVDGDSHERLDWTLENGKGGGGGGGGGGDGRTNWVQGGRWNDFVRFVVSFVIFDGLGRLVVVVVVVVVYPSWIDDTDSSRLMRIPWPLGGARCRPAVPFKSKVTTGLRPDGGDDDADDAAAATGGSEDVGGGGGGRRGGGGGGGGGGGVGAGGGRPEAPLDRAVVLDE